MVVEENEEPRRYIYGACQPHPSEVGPPTAFLEAATPRQLCFMSKIPSSYPADRVTNRQVANDIHMTGNKIVGQSNEFFL